MMLLTFRKGCILDTGDGKGKGKDGNIERSQQHTVAIYNSTYWQTSANLSIQNYKPEVEVKLVDVMAEEVGVGVGYGVGGALL